MKGKIMITKTLIVTGTALIVLGLFSGCSHRCHRSASTEKKTKHIVKKMTRILKLSESQASDVSLIVGDLMTKGQSFVGDRNQHQAAILAQLRSNELDLEMINKMADDKTLQIDEMKQLMITKFSELHALLTPEQRMKLADHIERKSSRFRHHR